MNTRDLEDLPPAVRRAVLSVVGPTIEKAAIRARLGIAPHTDPSQVDLGLDPGALPEPITVDVGGSSKPPEHAPAAVKAMWEQGQQKERDATTALNRAQRYNSQYGAFQAPEAEPTSTLPPTLRELDEKIAGVSVDYNSAVQVGNRTAATVALAQLEALKIERTAEADIEAARIVKAHSPETKIAAARAAEQAKIDAAAKVKAKAEQARQIEEAAVAFGAFVEKLPSLRALDRAIVNRFAALKFGKGDNFAALNVTQRRLMDVLSWM